MGLETSTLLLIGLSIIAIIFILSALEKQAKKNNDEIRMKNEIKVKERDREKFIKDLYESNTDIDELSNKIDLYNSIEGNIKISRDETVNKIIDYKLENSLYDMMTNFVKNNYDKLNFEIEYKLSNSNNFYSVNIKFSQKQEEEIQNYNLENIICEYTGINDKNYIDESRFIEIISRSFGKLLDDVKYNYLVPDIISYIMLKFSDRGYDIISKLDNRHKTILVHRSILKCLYSNTPIYFDKEKYEFNFQKNEILLYYIENVSVSINKKLSKRFTISKGVSCRICSGLYYRTGISEYEKIDYNFMESLGDVNIAITSKHIYFGSKRVQLNKIISVIPYRDGFIINIDRVRENEIYFYVKDPIFFTILIKNATYLN